MESKYYTPEIEEFHIGFRFEVLNNGVWDWQNMNASRLQEINLDDNLNLMSKYRVKYLDKEDIESLGFKKYVEPSYYEIEVNEIRYYLIEYGDNRYEIRPSHFSIQFGSFLGIIKNKSELKVLLKQLNVI